MSSRIMIVLKMCIIRSCCNMFYNVLFQSRDRIRILPNSPAIWGGCVTRREHRAPRVLGAGTLAEKLSRCKEDMARVFAVMVQVLLRSGAIAVQV
jgi:hypothetical protein